MSEKGVLASLSPEMMDRICDALIAKLALKNEGDLLPKQGVVGSNPITRSTFIHHYRRNTNAPCLLVLFGRFADRESQ